MWASVLLTSTVLDNIVYKGLLGTVHVMGNGTVISNSQIRR
jgi:hypothetical protein